MLCGNNGEACWAKYGAYPLHRPYCHEMALRILLAAIESHANRYKRHIVPVLSLSIDFYVRVCARQMGSCSAASRLQTFQRASKSYFAPMTVLRQPVCGYPRRVHHKTTLQNLKMPSFQAASCRDPDTVAALRRCLCGCTRARRR